MTGAQPKRDDRVRTFLSRDREDRTSAIVAAAYQLLDEGGLDDLTIRAVLKSTGLARRAFYERFAGKDDLVLAVFEQAMRYAAEMYGELVDPIPEPLERLRAIVVSIGRGSGAPDEPAAQQNSRMAAALSREHIRLAESHPAQLQAALEPLFALIAKQIADGIARGQIRQGDPARLTLFIYNLIATTVHTELISGESGAVAAERRERLADDLWEFCRRAIVA